MSLNLKFKYIFTKPHIYCICVKCESMQLLTLMFYNTYDLEAEGKNIPYRRAHVCFNIKSFSCSSNVTYMALKGS